MMTIVRARCRRGAVLLAVAALPAGAALLLGGCSKRYVLTERGTQAYYQTGWPQHDTSQQLERILATMKRVQITGYYETFRFAAEDQITERDIRVRTTYRRALERFTFDHSKAGTATVIGRAGNSVRLITNEHVTRLPDTLIVYFGEERDAPPGRQAQRYVESVSIRTNQTNVVLGLPDAGPFRVLAADSIADIALLVVELGPRAIPEAVQVLRVPIGDPSRLVWGSFVYVLGFPRGHRMVTRGIVSDPGRRPDDAFLLDGMFNRGISGGLILAVRGDTGALEWVGMATSASGQAEFLLMPDRRQVEEDGMLLPYEGRLYMERATRIDYGITFSVPMGAIQRFLRGSGYWQPL
jgi:S1-C subfamily serine protease